VTVQFYVSAFVVFGCGAFYEGSGIMWVHWAERNCAICVGMISALQAVCQLTGIGASLTNYAYAPFFIAGYFVGPFLVVSIKRWHTVPKKKAMQL
jgi:hypothetical protein